MGLPNEIGILLFISRRTIIFSFQNTDRFIDAIGIQTIYFNFTA